MQVKVKFFFSYRKIEKQSHFCDKSNGPIFKVNKSSWCSCWWSVMVVVVIVMVLAVVVEVMLVVGVMVVVVLEVGVMVVRMKLNNRNF